MVKNDNIRIKKKEAYFFLYGFGSLLTVLLGIFLIGLPFLLELEGSALLLLPIIGSLVLVVGGILYALVVYRGLKPKDALIITNKGFTNCLLGGKDGVYVEWTGVTSMKVFGLTKSPMLGLSLADNDAYLATLDGSALKDARANVDLGLPIIAIAQRDVFVQISELKNLFSRMIKGAISWEHYSAQGKKSDDKHTADAPAFTPAVQEEAVPAENVAPVSETPSQEQPAAKTAEFPFEKTRVVESPEEDAISLEDTDDEE
ncbi:MAG: hypothetical protein IJB88_06220 [Clostridia bacterium]|nr:hypothetical protein [Clostridia bacterium]